MFKKQLKNIPSLGLKITTIDMHTGGESLRIIIDGLPEIHGDTMLEKRRFFMMHYDHIRTGLMWEPRGHADMYGAIITDAVSTGADFGVLFMHNEGYSTMCGHATLALTKLVLDLGWVEKTGDQPELVIDAPPGTLYAKGFRKHGKVQRSAFQNVPSFALYLDEKINVPGIGKVKFDVAFGGAFYAFVQADELGLKLDASDHNNLIDYGRRIKQAVIENFPVNHPVEKDLSFLYGTIFLGDAHDPDNHSRNVCIFANGELDRSATGSGVSARAALHHAKGELDINQKITIESIIGSTMDVEIKDVSSLDQYKAVLPEVSGTAHFTGKHEFWFETEDPLKTGFILR